MKLFKSFLILFFVVSCAPIYVNHDYERKQDFSQYKTYNYYSDLQTGLSPLDSKRLLNAFDEAMNAKGLTFSEKPDFFVDINSSEYQENRRSSVGVGVGGSGRNIGGGISVGIPVGNSQVNRQIIFDFVDENGIGLFWQAVSESTYNEKASPEKREARLKAIVEKVLEGFPPETN
ncbi:MAG: DUF4136 domain-containing protein [Flavobacteriaceae bacterium]|nr:DUF4136 domain-containing protein [Flavobacteriaceae bacterium]